MSQPNKKSVSGRFWFAGNPDNSAPGVLNIYDNGEMDLELFSSLREHTNDQSDTSRINGKVNEFGAVTLSHCFYQYEELIIDDISTSLVIVNEAILGVAHDESQPLEFNSLAFEIDNLHVWSNISGITRNVPQGSTFSVEFNRPEDLTFKLNNGFDLILGFGFSVKSPTFAAINLEQSIYWKLRSENLRPLEDFRECAFKINNFLSLAMDQPVCMRNFRLTRKDIAVQHGESKFEAPLKLIYSITNYQEKPTKAHIHTMLFGFPRVRENFETIINTWLDLYSVADPALNLFFSVINEPNKFSETKFLSLAQSMETLHRRTNHATAIPEDEYEDFKNRMISCTPIDTHDWLQAKLKFGNEITFKNRLLELISPFEHLLENARNKKNIAHKIVTSRNYYTHYSPELEKDALKGEGLLNLTYTMEALCKLILLKMLGFKIDEIEGMIGYGIKQALQASLRNNNSKNEN